MRKYLIVLAEDCLPDVFLTQQALDDSGLHYDLIVLEDGTKAEEFARTIDVENGPRPDLLLVDLNLPKMEGTDFIRMCRQHPGCNAIPVIVVTSSDSPKDRARAAELEVAAYFRKPSKLDEFMQLGALARSLLEKPQSAE